MPKSPTPLALEVTDGRRTATVSAPDGAGTAQVMPHRAGSGGARLLLGAFLPSGYPASVSSDYLSYQLWDSIQGLSSYVRGMLSSQAMLAGVGVGSATATPLSAVYQFFIRDFSGMLGGVLFAACQGAGLDAHAKQWRLLADVMNDIGLALELASPLLPRAFLLLACLGSLARAITGTAGAATRMALTQHFAMQRNAADIAAKEGSQETAVTLLGMLLGMALLHVAAGKQTLVWAASCALTVLHVWANVRAMRCLRITSLNQARLGLLLQHYLFQGEVLSPDQAAAQESLVPPPLQRLLRMLGLGAVGTPFVRMAPQLSTLSLDLRRQLATLLQQAAAAEGSAQQRRQPSGGTKRYLAAAAPRGDGRSFGPDAVVLLRQGAGPEDVLEAYCAALMLAWQAEMAAQKRSARFTSWPAAAQLAVEDVDHWLAPPADSGSQDTPGPQSCTAGGYAAFLAALAAAGWGLDRTALLQGPSRLSWGTDLHVE